MKATSVVNEKVRNQGLSAKEILFSRDQFSNRNLDINDKEFVKSTMESRLTNNIYSSIEIFPIICDFAPFQGGMVL